ncbi:septum formation family protein [Actinosynnema sp. NPDC050436]|uniref:septum formation family protein n=1 Tax=Actinosynnema sp. NPDC050436 TaxID=3155659 RepID=UPI0033E76E3E
MSRSARWFRRGDQLVMLGAFVGAFALLGLSTFTSWPVGSGGPVPGTTEVVNPVYTSQAGDCLNWTKSTLSDVAKVDCKAQHMFEVTGVEDIGGAYGPQAPFPTDEQWQAISEERCAKTSLAYLGGKFDPAGKYSVGPLNPGERLWQSGQRTMRCGLQVAGPAGGLLPAYGTAKTQDQSAVYDPGVCLGITEALGVGDPVDCAEPHTFEIVGVVPLPAGDYPAVEKQDETLSAECTRIAAEYSGGVDFKAKGLIVTWDTRTPESWAAGSYRVNCKVGATPAPDNKGLTAWEKSIRNPNAPPLTTANPPQTTAVQQDEPTGAPLHSESKSGAPTTTSATSTSEKPTATATTTTTTEPTR